MNFSRFVPALIVTLFLHAVGMHAAEQASCTFDTFSAPPGYTLSQVQGVSDDGTVVGQLIDNKTLQFLAFKRSASGAIAEYAAPQSSSTWLYGSGGINVDAGYYQDKVNPERVHGLLLQDGEFTAVHHPRATNTWLFDINHLGAVVGSFSSSAALVRGFLLVNGTYTTIAYPDAETTYAVAINDSGDVVGSYASNRVSSGFLWQNGTLTTINYPDSRYGTALTGVNNAGVIVGNHLALHRDFGFIYEGGVFKDVVYPGAKFTMVGGINNNGLISGEIFLTSTETLGYTALCH